MWILFRWARTICCSSFMPPIAATARLAGRYDNLSPALLRLLHFVVEKAAARRRRSSCMRRDGGAAGRSACTARNWRADSFDVAGRDRTGESNGPFARFERGHKFSLVGAEAARSPSTRDFAALRGRSRGRNLAPKLELLLPCQMPSGRTTTRGQKRGSCRTKSIGGAWSARHLLAMLSAGC